MLVKISGILYLIAAILFILNKQMLLFGFSIVFFVITIGLSVYTSYRKVSIHLRAYRESVWQKEAEGASDEEILAFMDQKTEVDEIELREVPLWINIIVILGIIVSFILFIWAIINYL